MSNEIRHFVHAACLTGILATTGVSAQSNDGTLHITHELSYQAGSAEASNIEAWLQANSPELGAIRLGGKITVINSYSMPRAVAARSGLRPSGPTAELPKTGTPGQRASIEDELPDGTRQSWKYEWRGGGTGGGGRWEIIHYGYDEGGREAANRPQPRPGYR